MLESYYYNIKSAAWEPVVDVVDGEEPGTQKPWEMTLKVGTFSCTFSICAHRHARIHKSKYAAI